MDISQAVYCFQTFHRSETLCLREYLLHKIAALAILNSISNASHLQKKLFDYLLLV